MIHRMMIVACLVMTLPSPATAQADSSRALRVTFLGTSGGPVAGPASAGSAALVEYGNEVVLIDAGRGAVQQMQRINQNLGAFGRVFLTHLHSDHTVGLPELWLARWTRARFAPPLEVFGPAGTRDMVRHIREAWKYDVDIRSGPPENNPRASTEMRGIEVRDGMQIERNGMRITVIRVDHGPVLTYGYRIDAGGHSIVFSGDDIASENLIEKSRGVDVMVHNMSGYTPAQLADTGRGGEVRRAALKMLATPEQAGTVFARTAPRLAVLTHFNRAPEFVARTRSTYAGPLEEAQDLMRITIGDSISVEKPPLSPPAVLPPPGPPTTPARP
jgi:ribonuclease Z